MAPRNPWGDFTYANVWAPGFEDSLQDTPDILSISDELELWRRHQFAAGSVTEENVQDLNLYWHPQQWRALVESKARFKVIAAGWGWGKSIGLSQYLVKQCLIEPGIYWWVAPTYGLARIIQREYLSKIIPIDALAEPYHKAEGYYLFKNGSQLWIKSADNIASLMGARVKGMVIDEACQCGGDVWEKALRGRLTAVPGSWAVFISTPWGHDWFYKLWLLGQDPSETEWESWRFPTAGNPMVDPSDVESARRQLSAAAFAQSYLAEFLADGTHAFPGIDNVLRPLATQKFPGRFYIGGWDLGNEVDFAVGVGYDSRSKLPHYLDRSRQTGWKDVERKIKVRAREYPGQTWVDATGLGDPIFNFLHYPSLHDGETLPGINVMGYKLSNESKRILIQEYQHAIEFGHIYVPCDGPHGEIYVQEHKSFRPTLTRTGKIKWEAPPGYHDDCVIAGALANWGLKAAPMFTGSLVATGGGTLYGKT